MLDIEKQITLYSTIYAINNQNVTSFDLEKMKKTLFSLAILCFVATSLLAQEEIKGQAHISYEITEVKSQDMMASMMKGSTMDLYITEKNSHSSMNMMKGMINI